MLKSLTLCSALLLALLLVPAAVADEATASSWTADTASCSTPAKPAPTADTAATEAAVDNPVDSTQGALFLSVGCDPCRNACALTSWSCKAACGTNWSCIQQCNCDFYWCVDACVECGEQDPPPAGC
jgi:hypothetical protein